MKRLINKPNTKPANAEFPFGKSADNTGANDGTELNCNTLEDWHQFFEKMMDFAGVIANEEFDNAYSGFQLFEALTKSSLGCKIYRARIAQSGSGAPTVVIHGPNTIGNIVWTRLTTGLYFGTLTGKFPADKTICRINGINTGFVLLERSTDDDNVVLITTDTSGTNADGKLINTSIEIMVFP